MEIVAQSNDPSKVEAAINEADIVHTYHKNVIVLAFDLAYTMSVNLNLHPSSVARVFPLRPFEKLNSATGDIPPVGFQGLKISDPPGTPAGSLAAVVSL